MIRATASQKGPTPPNSLFTTHYSLFSGRGAQDRSDAGNSFFTLHSSPFTIHNLLFIILLVTCHSSLVTASGVPAAENAVRYEAFHESMGTIFTVAVYGRDRTFLSEVVEEVFEEVDRLDAS